MRRVEFTTLTGREMAVDVEDRMYIDGEFVAGDGTLPTEHPPTGERLADVPKATDRQVDKAVTAAKHASDEWRALSLEERRDRMGRLAERCVAEADSLAALDVADNGSCLSRMEHDATAGASALKYYAGLAFELKGETIPMDGDVLDFTVREPYGAVAAVLPFNHPLMFCLQTIATATAAGNGIVIKPSEYTSLSTLRAARLIHDTNLFPPGLVNVVTGRGEVGSAVTQHPDVGLVTFIGSVETGKKVMQGAATHIAPVIMGTGGKNPVLVFPDVDPTKAADGATRAMSLQWQGQSCGSGSRLLVHEDVYDEVVNRVVENFESITVDDPFDEATEMGSIVSAEQYDTVLDYIETTKAEGGTLLAGGKAVDEYDTGYFVEPTIFEIEPDMTIAHEEIFGPVLSVMKWSSYDEGIQLANGTRYGLTASVWTDDLTTAHRAVGDLEAGYVWVNHHGPHHRGTPFGGFGQSGIGKKDSIQTLRDHTRVKNVAISLPDTDES